MKFVGNIAGKDGYLNWHYYMGESSRKIYQIADAETMKECFPGFHTLDVEMAIDNLIEIYRQRSSIESF